MLHRIAHRIFRPSSSSRVDINRFVEDGGSLEEYPFAYACLQDYARVPLVERAVESLHARIKRIGKGCTYVLPPYMCAMLRHSQTLELLHSNQDFYGMCVRSTTGASAWIGSSASIRFPWPVSLRSCRSQCCRRRFGMWR